MADPNPNPAQNTNVTLATLDGESYEGSQNFVKMAYTIQTMVEDLKMGGDEGPAFPVTVNLPMRGEIFTRVAEWCEHHQADPVHLVIPDEEVDVTSAVRTDDISPWDEQFMNTMNNAQILEIFNAANYLDLRALGELCLKTLSIKTKGRSAEEIRAIFNLPDDISGSDLEQIRIENSWILDKNENKAEPKT